MKKDSIEQGSAVTELVLDTSGLRPIGSLFDKETDDSFAAEFLRFACAESDRIMETNKFSVRHEVGTAPSEFEIADMFNAFCGHLSERICSHMHEYLVQHEGRVKQWADPDIGMFFHLKNDITLLVYNYFGKKVEVKYLSKGYKNAFIHQPIELAYKNHYRHPESTPNALTAKLDRRFQLENKLSEFIRKEESAQKEAYSILEKAKDAEKETKSAKGELILTGPLLLLALLVTAIGFGLPLDLVTPMESFQAFLKGLWKSNPSGLSWIGCALLSVIGNPLVGIIGYMGVFGVLIQDLFVLGFWWAVIPLAVFWAIVLAVLYFLGFFKLFSKHNHLAFYRYVPRSI